LNSDYIQTTQAVGVDVKEVQIADGIVPLGEFKAQAAKLLKRIGESGQPMVITQNGRPAGVLLSPREYDRMQERQRFLESIAAGLADAESGRTMNTMVLRERLRAWRSDRDDG
jgi:prevent-host-death family protein